MPECELCGIELGMKELNECEVCGRLYCNMCDAGMSREICYECEEES